jgi:hypothetical protein
LPRDLTPGELVEANAMAANRSTREPQELGWFPLAMTVAIGASRLLPYLLKIPYPWNFAPVGAMSLYGGARLRFWQALTLPLLLMAVTDSIIWLLKGYTPFDPWVYGSLLATVLLGRLLTRTNSPWRIGAMSLVASAQFFLVTNFGVWLASRVPADEIPAGAGMMKVTEGAEGAKYPTGEVRYANNARGLATCYLMAVKFEPDKGANLGFTLPLVISDLFFTGLLFGVHALALGRVGRRASATAPGGAS